MSTTVTISVYHIVILRQIKTGCLATATHWSHTTNICHVSMAPLLRKMASSSTLSPTVTGAIPTLTLDITSAHVVRDSILQILSPLMDFAQNVKMKTVLQLERHHASYAHTMLSFTL